MVNTVRKHKLRFRIIWMEEIKGLLTIKDYKMVILKIGQHGRRGYIPDLAVVPSYIFYLEIKIVMLFKHRGSTH